MKDITTGTTAVAASAQELSKQFWQLLDAHRWAFKQDRTFVRMCVLCLGAIFTFARHTLTQALGSLGQTQGDWSAWYRLFSKARIPEEDLATQLAHETFKHVSTTEEAYVTGVDCTQIPRSSQKFPGSGWLPAPRSAVFKRGLHRAQRFLHCAWLPKIERGYTRAIPLRMLAAFSEKAAAAAAPSCKDWAAALQFMLWMRSVLDGVGRLAQLLVVVADGAFDKAELWRSLPERVILIARTATNRVLYEMLPVPLPARSKRKRKAAAVRRRGRPNLYGPRAPTPNQHLHMHSAWQTFQFAMRGRMIRLRFKIRGCYLRQTVPGRPVFLLVIAGAEWHSGKRLRRKHYRLPAYFLISAVQRDGVWCLPFSPELIVQWVWQRWELEVTHRELKTGFGLGQMQCWSKISAVLSVQWMTWLYAVILLAGYRTWGWFAAPRVDTAWWRGAQRWSFNTLLTQLRSSLWHLPEFRRLLLVSSVSDQNSSNNWGFLARAAVSAMRG